MTELNKGMFEVLSPWADADPIPLRGLAPRLDSLQGKKIGLLCNNKRAGEEILKIAARRLTEKFPDIEFSWFKGNTFSVTYLEKQRLTEFDDWIKSVDAVLAAAAD
ncbi:MAG TPA: hypothetical protein VLH15_01450 [Dehalococcoidales bacterium]|nr:hypothetical protein [Dehalococcoidales bacterium]